MVLDLHRPDIPDKPVVYQVYCKEKSLATYDEYTGAKGTQYITIPMSGGEAMLSSRNIENNTSVAGNYCLGMERSIAPCVGIEGAALERSAARILAQVEVLPTGELLEIPPGSDSLVPIRSHSSELQGEEDDPGLTKWHG
ncbi:hypothetical protein K469DRAFT_687481 [Zopfia rhizophila CBS 207.26]|uniref:Uncharacterized protein n=1 Tax=Zopfia rhizophila CBS 207.26 TaxID=1314779 RepID=A0A6A6E6G8_9PEZI|nr:hypothetical protein K469DRAFT_687481 [Zopfia rhizophila CBS 207.26]